MDKKPFKMKGKECTNQVHEKALMFQSSDDYEDMKTQSWKFSISNHKQNKKFKCDKNKKSRNNHNNPKKSFLIAIFGSFVFGISAPFVFKSVIDKVLFKASLAITILVPILSIIFIFLWLKTLNIITGTIQILESILLFYLGFQTLIYTTSKMGKTKYFSNPEEYMTEHSCQCWTKTETDSYCNITSTNQTCEEKMMISEAISIYGICVGFIIIMIGAYIIIGTCLNYVPTSNDSNEENYESDEEEQLNTPQSLLV